MAYDEVLAKKGYAVEQYVCPAMDGILTAEQLEEQKAERRISRLRLFATSEKHLVLPAVSSTSEEAEV